MEALAQAACCCLLSEDGQAGRIGYLAGIDKAKFRRTVLPGDTVALEATITRNSSRMCVADVVARVEGEVCAQATQKYVMAKVQEEGERIMAKTQRFRGGTARSYISYRCLSRQSMLLCWWLVTALP